jgi:hypothetical protein
MKIYYKEIQHQSRVGRLLAISLFILLNIITAINLLNRYYAVYPLYDLYFVITRVFGGILVPALMYTIHFKIEVNEQSLIFFTGLLSINYPKSDLENCKIEMSLESNRSKKYNGKHFGHIWYKLNTIVILELKSGEHLIIHTKEPQQLLQALNILCAQSNISEKE